MLTSRSGRTQGFSNLNKVKSCDKPENPKAYRCDCCQHKKYFDYNRANRIRREELNQKKRPPISQNDQSIKPNPKLKCGHNSKDHPQDSIKTLNGLSHSESVFQFSLDFQTQKSPLQKDNSQSSKDKGISPKVDMDKYCSTLFQKTEGKKIKRESYSAYEIQIQLEGKVFKADFTQKADIQGALLQIKDAFRCRQ